VEAPSFGGVGGVSVAVAVGGAVEAVADPSRKSFRPWEVEAPFSFPFAVAAESDGEEGASYSVGAWEEEAFCPWACSCSSYSGGGAWEEAFRPWVDSCSSYSVGEAWEEAFPYLVVAHRLGALVASLLVVAF